MSEKKKTVKKPMKSVEGRTQKTGAGKGRTAGKVKDSGSRSKKTGQDVQKQEKTPLLGEWLYLTPEGTTVRSIGEALGEAYRWELWEEAGVLEAGLSEGKTMDFEAAEVHPGEEAIKTFLRQHGCSKVFLVTFAPDAFEEAEKIMKCVVNAAGGLFCGDTEDFTPVIRQQM